MSKLEVVSSRHDDLSRWGSRTFSLPELIPEVRELGLVNPESLPVSHRITHNIHITGQCKKRERNEKSACIVQFLNCNCIFPEGSSPVLLFFLLHFFFLNLETWLLRGLLFLARLRREASWGLRGTKAGGGWRIIISFPCLFNGIFILSCTLFVHLTLVHNYLISLKWHLHSFLLLFSCVLYLYIIIWFWCLFKRFWVLYSFWWRSRSKHKWWLLENFWYEYCQRVFLESKFDLIPGKHSSQQLFLLEIVNKELSSWKPLKPMFA